MPDGLSHGVAIGIFDMRSRAAGDTFDLPNPIDSLRPLQSAVTPARSTYPKDATSTGLRSPIAMSRFRHRRYRSGRGVAGAHEAHSPTKRTEAVWGHIARAFREPVTRDDDVADYATTQVIAEGFRAERFDGLVCRSSFGTDRFNVALFDLDAAKPSN